MSNQFPDSIIIEATNYDSNDVVAEINIDCIMDFDDFQVIHGVEFISLYFETGLKLIQQQYMVKHTNKPVVCKYDKEVDCLYIDIEKTKERLNNESTTCNIHGNKEGQITRFEIQMPETLKSIFNYKFS